MTSSEILLVLVYSSIYYSSIVYRTKYIVLDWLFT